MRDFCESCKYQHKCKLYSQGVNFCENCKSYKSCELKFTADMCKAYHDIECNNGYEEKNDYDEVEDEN